MNKVVDSLGHRLLRYFEVQYKLILEITRFVYSYCASENNRLKSLPYKAECEILNIAKHQSCNSTSCSLTICQGNQMGIHFPTVLFSAVNLQHVQVI